MSLLHSLLESPAVYRAGWALLHSLWQGAALAAVLAAALAALRKSDPRARYFAACAALLGLAVLPAATFVVLPAPAPPRPPTRVAAAAERATVTPSPGAGPAISGESGTRGVAATPLDPVARDDNWKAPAVGETSSPSAEAPPVRPPRQVAREWVAAAVPWVVPGWVAGVLALSVWNLGAWVAVRQLRSAATRSAGDAVEAVAETLRRRLGVRRPVAVLASAAADSPLVMGVVRPVILLPASVLSGLPVAQLEALLAHELAHVHRNDYLVNLLQSVIETLLFYHPAAWWVSRRIRQERENCCDDLAVAVTRDRASYARALAVVACVRPPAVVPAAAGGELLPRLRRVLGKPDADAAPSPRWLAGAAVALLCVAAGIATRLPSRATAAEPATRPTTRAATQPATRPAAVREMRVKVVRDDTSAPLPDASCLVTINGRLPATPFPLDERGECRIRLGPQDDFVRLACGRDGFVGIERVFTTARRYPEYPPIPESYTARLQIGSVIGGVVRDRDGNGVPDAVVTISVTAGPYFAFDSGERSTGTATTGPDGRWTFGGAPADVRTVRLRAEHPDYVYDAGESVPPAEFDDLREQKKVTIVRRGVTVEGVVSDEAGKPLAGAEVALDSFCESYNPTTDAAGHFRFRGMPRGVRSIKAKADGYAPKIVQVIAEKDTGDVQIRLEKGRVLRGRVVDVGGAPLARADVRVAGWRGVRTLNVSLATDADGRFVWTGAPPEPVALDVSRNGYLAKSGILVTAGGEEILIPLVADPDGRARGLIARGSVVDAETGAPIPRFRTIVTTGTGGRTWSDTADGANGRYEVPGPRTGIYYVVRIEADGYDIAESPPSLDKVLEWDARLKKGTPFSGTVLQPDGRPAAGAFVALSYSGSARLYLDDGRPQMFPQGEGITTTDDAGRYSFPSRNGKVPTLVLHESGWGDQTNDSGGQAKPITLRPWARVEVTVMKGDRPAAGLPVRINAHWPGSVIAYSIYETATDWKGRFAFDRLPDGPATVTVQATAPPANDPRYRYAGKSYTMALNLKPGETRAIRFGGTGRPVVGKLAVHPDVKEFADLPTAGTIDLVRPEFQRPADWAALAPSQRQKLWDDYFASDAYQKYLARPQGYPVAVAPDGTFRAVDIPAGVYNLNFGVTESSPNDPSSHQNMAEASQRIEFPETPGGRSDQPLEAGTLELRPRPFILGTDDESAARPATQPARRPPLEVGAMAPALEVEAADGTRIRLADYRGKYVLVDFWAAAYLPWLGELKHLERLRAATAGDGRLAMLGVNIDDRPDRFRDYVKAHPFSWPQGYAGPWRGSVAAREFGVGVVPSLWLIGPDGRVVARGMAGDALDEEIKKALAGKP